MPIIQRHASFIAAAFLTPSPDPWNQAIFAAPMLVLYLASIGIAFVVAPRKAANEPTFERHLKLVFAATVLEASRRRRHTPAQRRQSLLPRLASAPRRL